MSGRAWWGKSVSVWQATPLLEFDVDDKARLEINGDVDIVTITTQHSAKRYGVRFDSGSELTVDVRMLERVR